MPDIFVSIINNLNQVIDVLKSNLLSISISIALISGLVFFLPQSVFSRFNVSNLRENNISIIGAIAFISIFLTLLLIIYKLVALVYLIIRGFFELPRLSKDECSRLNYFLKEKKFTTTFNTTDGVIFMLCDKGLVYKSKAQAVEVHFEQDFHIYRWIYSRLINKPEIITSKLKEGRSNETN